MNFEDDTHIVIAVSDPLELNTLIRYKSHWLRITESLSKAQFLAICAENAKHPTGGTGFFEVKSVNSKVVAQSSEVQRGMVTPPDDMIYYYKVSVMPGFELN